MNILSQDWFWVTHHVIQILEIFGDIIAVDAVVKQTAQKYGFLQLASLCDVISKWVNFFLDLATGLIQAFKNKNGGSNEKTSPAPNLSGIPDAPSTSTDSNKSN